MSKFEISSHTLSSHIGKILVGYYFFVHAWICTYLFLSKTKIFSNTFWLLVFFHAWIDTYLLLSKTKLFWNAIKKWNFLQTMYIIPPLIITFSISADCDLAVLPTSPKTGSVKTQETLSSFNNAYDNFES